MRFFCLGSRSDVFIIPRRRFIWIKKQQSFQPKQQYSRLHCNKKETFPRWYHSDCRVFFVVVVKFPLFFASAKVAYRYYWHAHAATATQTIIESIIGLPVHLTTCRNAIHVGLHLMCRRCGFFFFLYKFSINKQSAVWRYEYKFVFNRKKRVFRISRRGGVRT